MNKLKHLIFNLYNMNNQKSAEMPKYKSHKEVWALKIKEIILDSDLAQKEGRETDGGAILKSENVYDVLVSSEYLRKHKPQVGGYYVVYEDGYKSWSPAKAFEEGYSLIK